MGTRFDFLTYGLDEDFFSTVKNFILNELVRIEQKFSRFDEESEIFKINKLAATDPVTTDIETISLLRVCQEYYLKTNRLFDITVGNFIHTDSPHSTEIGTIIDTAGADKIIIDLKESTVRFSNPLLSIDLGGIGKGYALERIKQYCIENRIANVLISFGDSSITTLGSHPHGAYWPIGIQDACSSGSSIHSFRLTNSSLSTSGNTPNNRKKFGAHGHILNPLTGEFQTESKTVSVVANSPMDAEVLSTSLFIATDSDKADILSRFKLMDSIGISYNHLNEHKVVDMLHDFTITSKKIKTEINLT